MVCFATLVKNKPTKCFQVGAPTFLAMFSLQIIFSYVLLTLLLIICVSPVVLHASEKDNLRKRHHLAEDEPDVDHLDV